jgi:hypothetical protein
LVFHKTNLNKNTEYSVTASERIQELLLKVKLKPSKFAEVVKPGVRAQWLYDIINEKKSSTGKPIGISQDLADLIIKAYPQVNRSWLLTGKGYMTKEYPSVGETFNQTIEEPQQQYGQVLPKDQMIHPEDFPSNPEPEEKRDVPLVLKVAVLVIGELFRSPEFLMPVNSHKVKVIDSGKDDLGSFALDQAFVLVDGYQRRLAG